MVVEIKTVVDKTTKRFLDEIAFFALFSDSVPLISKANAFEIILDQKIIPIKEKAETLPAQKKWFQSNNRNH